MGTKETNYQKVLKSNLILFLSYGILIGFLLTFFAIIIKYGLDDISNIYLSITLSLFSGILIFYLLHFIAKSSTLESFKSVKLSESDSAHFLKKMNLFFIICAILSIVFCISYLFLNNVLFQHALAQAYEKYEFFSPSFANQVAIKVIEQYRNELPSKVLSTVILELSLVTSFISLIPYQKKLLEKYNKSAD